MVTRRFRWLLLLSALGTIAGLLRRQELLALSSLSILVWLCFEWSCFRLRLLLVAKSLSGERRVNGSSGETGILWVGRAAEVTLQVSTSSPLPLSVLRIEDYLPDIVKLSAAANVQDVSIERGRSEAFTYSFTPRATGSCCMLGLSIEFFDLHGLFHSRCFVPLEQTFRVLPMPATADGPSPKVKLFNELSTPGIHRQQKAGIGAELLEIREYVPGDPPKSIAWKVSARRESLMVRQNEDEVPIRTTLIVDRAQDTRRGPFGIRPYDSIAFLAATIARSSLSVRDPVGMILFDEETARHVKPGGGQRHYYQLLEELTRGANSPAIIPSPMTQQLLEQTWDVANALYPRRLQAGVNRVPFFLFPAFPNSRQAKRQCIQLACLFSELYNLPIDGPIQLLNDYTWLAGYSQKFLLDAGRATSYLQPASREYHLQKLHVLTNSLLQEVARGRDHEVFVLLVDLLDHPDALGRLTHAIQVATARHHRVVIICPRLDVVAGQRMTRGEATGLEEIEQLLYEGERLRISEGIRQIRREIAKCGASLAFAGDPAATKLVLAKAELIRSGRTMGV